MATNHVCDVCGKTIKHYSIQNVARIPKLLTPLQEVTIVRPYYNEVDLCLECIKSLRESLGLPIQERIGE